MRKYGISQQFLGFQQKQRQQKSLFKPTNLNSVVLSLHSYSFIAEHSLSMTRNLLSRETKIVNNKIVHMEMYPHATRADLAELETEVTCRPATTKK